MLRTLEEEDKDKGITGHALQQGELHLINLSAEEWSKSEGSERMFHNDKHGTANAYENFTSCSNRAETCQATTESPLLGRKDHSSLSSTEPRTGSPDAWDNRHSNSKCDQQGRSPQRVKLIGNSKVNVPCQTAEIPRRKLSLNRLRSSSNVVGFFQNRRSFDPKLLSESLKMEHGFGYEDENHHDENNKGRDMRLHEIRKEIDISGPAQGRETPPLNTDSEEKLHICGKGADAQGQKRGKVANFFRKLSFGSMKDSNKSPNTRRSMPVLNAEHESHLKRGLDSSIEEITKLERSNSVMNQRDMLIHERDKAVEEWTKATAKWEQLLDEVEKLMTEVSLVKTENEEKGQELSEVITAYEEDLDKRDFDLQVLRERYIDLNEQVHVARKERLLTLTQYDDLLKKHYDLNKEFQEKKAEVATLNGRLREAEQKVNSLQQQVDICKHDRDHALRLWNSSVEERKKLHHEMASLIQARDASIRTAFNQAEEIIQIKDERDKLQRELDSAIRRSAEDSTKVATSDRNDSGYSADQDVTQGLSEIPETEPSSPTSICVTTEEERVDEEDCEVFAVSVDKMDSKFGLKVDNAVDDPRVYVTHVNSNTAARNNIRKYDRIISVNGVTVVKADKKTVDRLIRDCSGRLTLVLQRDKLANEWNSRYRDLELHWAKHSSESHLGLRCNVTVTDVNNAPLIIGSDEIQPGDIIHKINSQDISSLIASFIRKLSKKSGGKVTLRLKRNAEGTEDSDRAQGNQIRSPYNLKAPSVHSDTSSLSVCSFSSGQTSTTYNEDCTSLSSIDGNEDSRSYKIRSFGLSSKLKQLSNSLSFDHDELQLSLTLPRRKTYDRTVSDLGRMDSKRIKAGAQPSLERAKSETGKFADPAENLYESLNSRLLEQQLSRSSLESEKHRRRSMYSNRNSFLAAQNRPDFEAWKRQSLILAAMQQPDSGSVAGSPTEENVSVDIPRVESSSTLPRLVKRKSSVKTNEKRTSHRVLRLEKESHEDLGFRIQGGNRSGIFVAEIREGSIASKSGLLPGDKILHMNSYDFTSATMDYAMKVLLSHSSALHFRIEVFQDPRFQEILNDEPLDSIFVRTQRSFEASKPEEMSFVLGEILHVTNTLADFKKEARSWQWFAEKWRHGHATGEKGLIPSLEIFSDHDEAALSASDAELGKSDEEAASSHGVNSKRQKKTTDVRKWLLSRKPSLKKKREKERKQELINNDAQLAFYEILVEPPIARNNDEIGSPETEGS